MVSLSQQPAKMENSIFHLRFFLRFARSNTLRLFQPSPHQLHHRLIHAVAFAFNSFARAV
ncbi:MAG: hypothetical protein B6D41_21285 [Chloroflexi bacterium UTCFX4]|nr:MAG: hypothetical protein B6D41_21285 [Chloroflexi bacterium UTCFX4]